MVTISLQKLYFIKIKQIWFTNEISYINIFLPTMYVQSASSIDKVGFLKQCFPTKIIDLDESEEILQSKCRNNFFKLVRRSERENVIVDIDDDLNGFVEFYNKFAINKNLKKLKIHFFKSFSEHVVILSAFREERKLASHVYLVDRKSGIARQLYLAYEINNESKEWVSFIGNVNRQLYWKSVLYFKQVGFSKFDIGGYSDDQKLIGINSFKDNIAGIPVCTYNYYSIVYILMAKISKFLKILRYSRM